LLVKDAVDSIKKSYVGDNDNTKYGLYYPKLGCWLDDAKIMFAYDFAPEVYILSFLILLLI